MLTPEQKEMRRIGLGGSDIGAIANCKDAYSTPLDIYLSKIGGLEPEKELSFAMKMGNILEDPIANLYKEVTGKSVIHPPVMYIHPDYPFMIANPDRLIEEDNGILECKAVRGSKRSLWGEKWSDQIPDSYLLQVAHYASVLSACYVDIAVLFGGIDFEIFRYIPNKKLEEKIIGMSENFWTNHVLKRIPPDPVSYTETIKRWPISEKKSLYANEEQEDLLREYHGLKLEKILLHQREDEIKRIIAMDMQSHELLLNSNEKILVSWKERHSLRLDMERFKKEEPEMYKKYSLSSITRTFLTYERDE